MMQHLDAVQQAVHNWGGALPADPDHPERRQLFYPLARTLYDTRRLQEQVQATLVAVQTERAAVRQQVAPTEPQPGPEVRPEPTARTAPGRPRHSRNPGVPKFRTHRAVRRRGRRLRPHRRSPQILRIRRAWTVPHRPGTTVQTSTPSSTASVGRWRTPSRQRSRRPPHSTASCRCGPARRPRPPTPRRWNPRPDRWTSAPSSRRFWRPGRSTCRRRTAPRRTWSPTSMPTWRRCSAPSLRPSPYCAGGGTRRHGPEHRRLRRVGRGGGAPFRPAAGGRRQHGHAAGRHARHRAPGPPGVAEDPDATRCVRPPVPCHEGAGRGAIRPADGGRPRRRVPPQGLDRRVRQDRRMGAGGGGPVAAGRGERLGCTGRRCSAVRR